MRTALILLTVIANLAAKESPVERTERANKLNFCRGDHPRCKGAPGQPYKYHQFAFSSNIGEFFSIAEFLPPGPPIPHHQTFLSELISDRTDTNAVAAWTDAKAIANGGRVWGGFISARSEFRGDRSGGDAQLIGLEIDVLNDGKPGEHPYNSKVGLQVVGFGRKNTNAIELLTDGKGGQWSNGLNIQPNTISPDGAVFGIARQRAKLGVSMLDSEFSDSAVLVGVNQRISFRRQGSPDASIYRDNFDGGYLVLTAGPAGLRITNAENTRNLLQINPDGTIVNAPGLLATSYSAWIVSLALALGAVLAFTAYLALRLIRLERIVAAGTR